MLVVNNLSCVRQHRLLFEQLSFSLPTGQLLYIKGKNGAGKSSLLKILAGLMSPDEGQVLFQQQPIDQLAQNFNQSLCYLGHKTGVNLLLSGEENLDFWRHCHPCHDEPDSMSILTKLGLVGLEDVPAGQLSAGQQRRVALARLWVTRADLWILDEPFTALDVELIEVLKQRLIAHLHRGGSAIVTSHQELNMPEVQAQTLEIDYRM